MVSRPWLPECIFVQYKAIDALLSSCQVYSHSCSIM